MPKRTRDGNTNQTGQMGVDSLTVPISSRTQSFNSDASSNASPIAMQFSLGTSGIPPASSSIGSALSRGRAKTLTSLNESSKIPQTEMKPKEVNLPRDPHVNGQPIEAYLYKDAIECPICFLYYPKYLNKTRCCDQAMCSECFVQIKRPDPHPPEHASEPSAQNSNENANTTGLGEELVSEPAQCPYCNQPEFGITYEAPPFQRGLIYANQLPTGATRMATSAMSSSSSLVSGQSSSERFSALPIPHRRTTSISATDPMVITTDRIRPDWHQKLAAARAHNARRSAAATALHTAAYLMGSRGQDGDGRAFGAFGRRGILRRTSGGDSPLGGPSSSQLGMLALMSERYAAQAANRGNHNSTSEGDSSADTAQRSGARRRRVEDLEEMMMMEAIRLSLASEEERRRREEKETRREAKRKDKENRKAEKLAKRGGNTANALGEMGTGQDSTYENPDQSSDTAGKGKSAEQTHISQWTTPSIPALADPRSQLERVREQNPSNDISTSQGSVPYRPSHLRTLSNASSSMSSIDGSAPASMKNELRDVTSSANVPSQTSGVNDPGTSSTEHKYLSETPPANAGGEPIFNFRSLAAMVGESDKLRDPASLDTSSTPDHYMAEQATTSESLDIDRRRPGRSSSSPPADRPKPS